MARPLRQVHPIPAEPPIGEPTPSTVTLLKNLISETGELVRAEADVIKLEMQESTRAMLLDSVKVAVWGGVTLLGVLSLMAFLIIAFGDLITGGIHDVRGFWISALVIGILFTAIGGWLAYRNATHIGKDIGMPKTRTEIRTTRRFMQDETTKMRETTKP